MLCTAEATPRAAAAPTPRRAVLAPKDPQALPPAEASSRSSPPKDAVKRPRKPPMMALWAFGCVVPVGSSGVAKAAAPAPAAVPAASAPSESAIEPMSLEGGESFTFGLQRRAYPRPRVTSSARWGSLLGGTPFQRGPTRLQPSLLGDLRRDWDPPRVAHPRACHRIWSQSQPAERRRLPILRNQSDFWNLDFSEPGGYPAGVSHVVGLAATSESCAAVHARASCCFWKTPKRNPRLPGEFLPRELVLRSNARQYDRREAERGVQRERRA